MSFPAEGRYRSRSGAEHRGQVFGERLMAVFRSALAYQLMVGVGLAILLLGVWIEADVRDQSISHGDREAFTGLVIGTMVSVIVGQLLAVLRVREWVLIGTCLLWYGVLGGMEGQASEFRQGGVPGMVLAILSHLGPLFVLCASWSLRTGRSLLGAWLPLMLAAGGGVLVAQANEKIPAWEEGDKWQVWEPLTLVGLALMVLLLLLFLAARERQGLKMWQRGEGAHLPGAPVKRPGPRPRLSALGWSLMIVMGLGIAAGTASTAPFLWEIDSADEGSGSQEGEPKRTKDYKDSNDRGKLKGTSGDGPDWGPQPMGGNVPPWFLLNLLLSLLFLALLFGYRPVKRLLIIRHLRQPFWHLDATQRIVQCWRLVEIALRDAGFRARPGQPASRLLESARPLLSRVMPAAADIQGLEQAAQIRDRVAFGLGIGPDDERVMIQVSNWAFDSIWESLGDASQLRAMYRGMG